MYLLSGHTESWGKGVIKLLTPCFTNHTFNGKFGPIDPSRDQNFKFMRSLLKEIDNVFPDDYIHIGGDEVNYDCWFVLVAFIFLCIITIYSLLTGTHSLQQNLILNLN